MKIVNALIIFFCLTSAYTQEKEIWAKSFINKKAPEIVVEEWISEKPETKGKFVLIDFWATWCEPCKRAIPELNSFHREFSKHLVVIGISNEPSFKVKQQTKPRIKYYSAIDTEERLEAEYGVQGIPHCVIINPDGIVVWEGFPQLEGHELTAEVIKKLIASK